MINYCDRSLELTNHHHLGTCQLSIPSEIISMVSEHTCCSYNHVKTTCTDTVCTDTDSIDTVCTDTDTVCTDTEKVYKMSMHTKYKRSWPTIISLNNLSYLGFINRSINKNGIHYYQ